MKAGSLLHVLSHLPLQLLEPVRRAHPDVVLTHVPMQGEPPEAPRAQVRSRPSSASNGNSLTPVP